MNQNKSYYIVEADTAQREYIFENHYRIQKNRESHHIFAAVEKSSGKIIGFITGRPREDVPESWFIASLWVKPEYRRQGIGRAVVRAMLAEAEKKHVSSVFLEVRVSNEAARRLYLSEGFLECGIRKGFYKRPVEDAIQMVYNFKNVDKG